MWGALLGDIENRRDAGMQVVNARMDDMRYYVSVLKNYIPDELGSDEGFEDAIQAKLDELDYFNWDSYRENYEVFRTYSSSSVGYEPYYNHKNLTHSSYQIHPFLWRFVRASRMKDVMSRSFDSFFNDRLEIGNIAGHLDSIIGRFGEVVDIWLNNTIDFSGYTTRYEMSEHVGTNVGYSPVVDYDGAFYPPAVEEYVKSPATAAKTVRDAMTKASFVSECVQPNVAGEVSSKDALAAALSAGFGYFADFDPNVYVNAVDERIPLSSAPHFNNIQKTLVDVLPETFFGKYYSHLQLKDEDNLDRMFIGAQLGSPEISARIFDIVQTKSNVRDVYDIYRYGMDSFDNMYVLYKRYGDESPSYQDKKNTPGQLWVRRKDHPIAFPAVLPAELSGLQAIYRSPDMNSYLMLSVQDAERYCFDFEFSDNKDIMAIMARNPALSGQVFDRYEYCDVVMSKIDYDFDSVFQKRELLKFTTDGDKFDDMVVPAEVPTEESIREISSGVFWSLLGAYPTTASDVRLVYATKRLELVSQDQVKVELPPVISARIAFFDDSTSHVLLNESTYRDTTLNTTTDGSPRIPTGQDIVFANDTEQGRETVVFAFATRKAGSFSPEYSDELTVSVERGSSGGTIDDALSPEMNSFDVFDSDIMLSRVGVYSDRIQDAGPGRIYNINADISYQPLYPGDDGLIKLDPGREYHNIELLGRSRDISRWVDAINKDPDPFMEISDIVENHTFGRVYEDYVDNLSDCLVLFDNPAFSPNSPETALQPVVSEDGAYYAWTIQVPQTRSLDKMNLAFFNKESLGKNPYLMCALSDLVALSGGAVAASYDSAGEVSEIPVGGQHIECTVVGTQRQGQTNQLDTNRLPNIRSIDVRYTGQGFLVVRFWLDEPRMPSFIGENTIRVALYDQHNIEQFQYYHLLDAYGVVNVYQMYTDEDIYGKVISGEGWQIVYDRKDISEDDQQRVRSAINVDGRGRVYLQDIDLSKYGFLSSVYLFNQNKVAFKYNDEHRFPRMDAEYFYPFLNRKYPSTAAQVFEQNLKFGVDTELVSDDFRIFDDTNLFTVDLGDEYEVLSSIGNLKIPVYQNFDDSDEIVRVYEDYLSTFNDGDISGYNELKYDVDDPHIFEFVHFCALSSPEKDISADDFGLSVDESEISGNTASQFLAYIDDKFEDMDYVPFGQSNSEYQTSSSVTVRITPENTSLGDFLKIFVNYKKEGDGTITLYFNYENYINTPYVRISGGRVRSQIVDGTYLRLGSGESGILDIVVQFRYYNGDELFGYRNVKLLSYGITNLSDDKPKFFIRKVYQADNSDVQLEENRPTAIVKVNDVDIDCDRILADDPSMQDRKYDFYVDV